MTMKKLKPLSKAWFKGDEKGPREIVTVIRHGRDGGGIYTEIEFSNGRHEKVHRDWLEPAS